VNVDPRTGSLYWTENSEQLKALESRLGTKLLPLTEKQAQAMAPLSNRMRKRLLGGMACPCASGRSFKKCCGKKMKG
jgi:uncharacterized protein YecA (UPF0149 family)